MLNCLTRRTSFDDRVQVPACTPLTPLTGGGIPGLLSRLYRTGVSGFETVDLFTLN